MRDERSQVNSAVAKHALSDLIRRAENGEHIVLSRYNRPAAVLIPMGDAEMLREMKAEKVERRHKRA